MPGAQLPAKYLCLLLATFACDLATQLMPAAHKQGRQKCNAKATGEEKGDPSKGGRAQPFLVAFHRQPLLLASATQRHKEGQPLLLASASNLCPVRISKGGTRRGNLFCWVCNAQATGGATAAVAARYCGASSNGLRQQERHKEGQPLLFTSASFFCLGLWV
jgi:hypothetical protein